MPICFRLLTHFDALAVFLALFNAGNSIEARIAIIAMTTRSSMSVKLLLEPSPDIACLGDFNF
jgi:hypothetical protein